MAPRLFYLGVAPARGDPPKLLLEMGGVEYEEVSYSFEAWERAKSGTLPFHQLPILELDSGERLSQSHAITRYCASIAKLYPDDPLEAARHDEVMGMTEDVLQTFSKRPEDKSLWKAYHEDIVRGPLLDKLKLLDAHVATFRGPYISGPAISYGDLWLFVFNRFLVCGFWPGIPADLLSAFPHLEGFCETVARHPQVHEFYKKHQDQFRKGFLPKGSI